LNSTPLGNDADDEIIKKLNETQQIYADWKDVIVALIMTTRKA